LILPKIIIIIQEANFLRLNYKNELIPVGVGLVFFLTTLLVVALFLAFLPEKASTKAYAFLLAFAIFTCLGLIDDVWGSKDTSGLKGHLFTSIKKGQLTTGAIKAIFGLVGAALLTVSTGSWLWVLVNILMVVLTVNTINLLDLRPGRAGKGFLFLAVIFFILGWGREELIFLAAVSGSLLAYLGYDLKARTMMGDTGANALGAALGVVAVWVLAAPAKIIYLVCLIIFHIITEKYSVTKIIARNRFLNFLDLLGRK
jgi:UDP-N-acetylmuramyl pentapeptide phosphotransferase/UDP-N-acetylglucosamine-1-phosphate transferase